MQKGDNAKKLISNGLVKQIWNKRWQTMCIYIYIINNIII